MNHNDETNKDVLRYGSKNLRNAVHLVAFAFKGLIKTTAELNPKVTNAIKVYNNSLSTADHVAAGNGNSLSYLSNDIRGNLMLDIQGKIGGFDKPSKEYNVDYVAFYNQKADKTYLMFRGKDMESINRAFQSYMNNCNGRNKISIYNKITEIEAAKVSAPAALVSKGIGKAVEAGSNLAKQSISHSDHTR